MTAQVVDLGRNDPERLVPADDAAHARQGIEPHLPLCGCQAGGTRAALPPAALPQCRRPTKRCLLLQAFHALKVGLSHATALKYSADRLLRAWVVASAQRQFPGS